MTVRTYRQSAIKRWKRCKRSTWLQYFRDLHRPPSPFLPKDGGTDLGTLVHLGLEQFHQGLPWREALIAWRLDRMRVLGEVPALPDDYQKVYDLAWIMLEGFEEWADEEGVYSSEETLYVEANLKMGPISVLGDEVYVTGKVDRVAVDKNSGLIIVDDMKTRDQFTSTELLQVDDQVLTYAALLKAFNPDLPMASVGRHTILRKVKRTAKAKPPFYKTVDITMNEDQHESHWAHLMSTLHEMVAAEQSLEAGVSPHLLVPPTPHRDCDWDCPFFGVCPMADDGSDFEGALSELYVVGER